VVWGSALAVSDPALGELSFCSVSWGEFPGVVNTSLGLLLSRDAFWFRSDLDTFRFFRAILSQYPSISGLLRFWTLLRP
jgi:hypothetical protein